jgi:hypothetical protein
MTAKGAGVFANRRWLTRMGNGPTQAKCGLEWGTQNCSNQ